MIKHPINPLMPILTALRKHKLRVHLFGESAPVWMGTDETAAVEAYVRVQAREATYPKPQVKHDARGATYDRVRVFAHRVEGVHLSKSDVFWAPLSRAVAVLGPQTGRRFNSY